MLVSGTSDEAVDHKDQSASPPEHPELMRRVRFEVSGGGQHAAAGAGVSTDAMHGIAESRCSHQAGYKLASVVSGNGRND